MSKDEDEIAEHFTNKRRKTEPWRKDLPDRSKVAELLTRLLADVDDAMEFHGTVFKPDPTPRVKEALSAAAQAIKPLILEGKIEAKLELLTEYDGGKGYKFVKVPRSVLEALQKGSDGAEMKSNKALREQL